MRQNVVVTTEIHNRERATESSDQERTGDLLHCNPPEPIISNTDISPIITGPVDISESYFRSLSPARSSRVENYNHLSKNSFLGERD